MAASITSFPLLLAALLALGAAGAQGAEPSPAKPQIEPGADIEYEADSSEIDYKSNTAVLHGVSIRQGTLKIRAKQAEVKGGVNFANNEWQFSDDVHITTATGALASGKANVTFIDNRVTRVFITGSPATFEQKLENNKGTVRGRAGTIEYTLGNALVKLTDDVWFTNGKDEFSSNLVVYSVREERVQINPGGQAGRVKGIIRTPPKSLQKSEQPSLQPKGAAAALTESTP